VSKKNRQRRGTAGKPGDTGARAAVNSLFDQIITGLWAALKAGDLLRAEVETAQCMMVPRMLGMDDVKATSSMIDLATESKTPEDAALLRLITVLGPPVVKRAASRALGKLTAEGIYAPEWAAEAGRATPVRAWRRYDEFGDSETIIVTYRYGESEHAWETYIDLAQDAGVTDIDLKTDTAGLEDSIEGALAPFERYEEISLGQARRHLELAMMSTAIQPDLLPKSAVYLPIIGSRLRRLPVEDSATIPVFTAADRAAAVVEFMKSPEAAEAVAADEEATRFWAETLTAYSSRIPDEPPVQVGPEKLEYIFNLWIPRTYTLTEAQRRHVRPAVTAWARWSVAYRGMDEAAAEHMTHRLPEILDGFDEAYDDPNYETARAYLADVATSDADLQWLAEIAERRALAMPTPGNREDDEETNPLDATDPADRRAYAAVEFGDCELPEGVSNEEFIAAAQRVVEQLWQGEHPELWERSKRLLDAGTDRHDVIHALISSDLGLRS
jgi:hypothetical protein